MQNVREEEKNEHPLKCVKAMKIENITYKAGSGFFRTAFLLLIKKISFFCLKCLFFFFSSPFNFTAYDCPESVLSVGIYPRELPGLLR